MARHKSVYDDIDRSSREYIVRKRDGTKRYTPLPEVTLSFEEPVENVYFSDRAMKTNEFSPTFSKFYDAQMANLTTKFVSMGQGYGGKRFIPIKFHKNKEPCIHHKRKFKEPMEMLTYLETAIETKGLNPYSGWVRQAETFAINELTSTLPRTTRDAEVLHWVCHWPEKWSNAQRMDTYYTKQWLDAHTHPAWFYPSAAVHRGHMTLLKIKIPAGTPVLRTNRHSSKRADVLNRGEWTYYDSDPNETEVRLPPGKYVVYAHTVVKYANRQVRLIEVVYQRIYFDNCKKRIEYFKKRDSVLVF